MADFYATAKASFDLFDYYSYHADILASYGYASLIQSVKDTSVLNSMAVLTTGLDIPEAVMGLLRSRSIALGQDLDSFHTKTVSAIQAEIRRQTPT